MRKKCMALGLLLCLLPGLAGCRFHKSDSMDFYYVRSHYQYGKPQGVIYAESRDVTGHAQDLPYLMALYLSGPLDEGLSSPFPRGTRLVSLYTQDNTLFVELTPPGSGTSSTDFTLSSSCLALTFLYFSNVDQVTVTSGENTITLNAENLLLYDQPSYSSTTTEETK